jgi:hypothetical protein
VCGIDDLDWLMSRLIKSSRGHRQSSVAPAFVEAVISANAIFIESRRASNNASTELIAYTPIERAEALRAAIQHAIPPRRDRVG